MKRLLIDGESGLRQCFLTALEQVSHNVSGLDFAEQSMDSDFAIVEVKLQANTAALRAEARRAERLQRRVLLAGLSRTRRNTREEREQLGERARGVR